MPAYTSRLALPYPLGTDPPNGPGQIESLANVLDAAVGSTLIASQVLTVAEPSVTFSAIPQVFNHLLVKAVVRTMYAGGFQDVVVVWFNADAGAHYDIFWTEYQEGTSTNGHAPTPTTAAPVATVTAYDATAAITATLDLEIPCYTQTVFEKAFASRSGFYDGVGTSFVEAFYRGTWRSTAAITSMVFSPASGANFAIGSAFYLYGIN